MNSETVLSNAKIVLPDKVTTGSLVMRDGVISDVCTGSSLTAGAGGHGGGEPWRVTDGVGGSAVATKVAVSAISAVDVAILRTIIGGLVALPLALLLRIRLPATPGQRGLLLLSGFCGFIAFPLLFTLGVNLTSANHATMILAILPVLTGAIAMAWPQSMILKLFISR